MYKPLPCAQEPGTPEEIKTYAAGYGVEFDIFAKIDVNGSHAHPLYKFLKSRVSGGLGNFVKWNYEKVRSCDNHMTSLSPHDVQASGTLASFLPHTHSFSVTSMAFQ